MRVERSPPSTVQSSVFLAVTEMCMVITEHMSGVCVGRGRRPAGRLIKYAGSSEAAWNVAHLPARTRSPGAWRVMRRVCVRLRGWAMRFIYCKPV